MKTVIYIDVLFIINFFMTFLILLVTSKISKSFYKMYRILLAATMGGVYSFVIFAEDMSIFVSFLGKIFSALVIVATAFSFKRVSTYLKTTLVYFFSSMLLLGVIIALWFILEPPGIVINNDCVYFDVSATVLILSGASAYFISCAVIRIYNHIALKKQIYLLKIYSEERCVNLYAFADTGNKLKEPFSDFPVIIAEKSKVFLLCNNKQKRIVPFNTINSNGIMECFKPDKVVVCVNSDEIEIKNVYVALSDMDFSKKDFSAIFNPMILKY